MSLPAAWFESVVSGRIADLLMVRPAVVLERVARGGGATNWFYVASPKQLHELRTRLRPGSSVSFYFDGRIKRTVIHSGFVEEVLDISRAEGEAVVGILADDGLGIAIEFVTGPDDLTEMLSSCRESAVMFVGAFPARDNDGDDAITFDLADIDGIVRRHPH